MYNKTIKGIKPLGFTWETGDPFLFCVHHRDIYPKGNAEMGPAASLAGRNLGQDFDTDADWRMYHGTTVPGFPAHPHRGFETVTVVLDGFVDHSDSLGAAGRYGNGDVQWMTAGSGLQHAEMFPLVHNDKMNPLHLFQIWLNLPRVKKYVQPCYKMLWSEDIPTVSVQDDAARDTSITLIAGKLGDVQAPPPASDSWAADPENELGIWIIRMAPRAHWILPAASQPLNRTLYFFEGLSVKAAGSEVHANTALDLLVDQDLILENGDREARFLMLQGKPIAEPVIQYGPFVMNTQGEIRQAFEDYQRDRFGGWPWERSDPVHDRAKGRFADYGDGRVEAR